MKIARNMRRAALLGAASMAVVALTAVPSQAEQQVFKFFVNKPPPGHTGSGSSFKGPGCDAGTRTPGDGCITFETTSSQAGAFSEASSTGHGTQGGVISGTHSTLNDAFDGYGELTGGTMGGGGSPNAPINNNTPAPNNVAYGGLTVTRDVETTNGNPDADNPDGTTAITAPYTAHGIPNAGRFFETFTNNTSSTIDTIVSYTNNLGSDSNTHYFTADPATNTMTIDGSNTTTDPHPEFLTSQQYTSASDPTITAVFGNNTNFLNANFTAYHEAGDDNPSWTFHIVLAPGQTITLMTFVLLTGDMDRNDPTDNFGADGVTGTPDGIPDVLEKDITLGAEMANILLNGGNPIDPDSWIFAGLTVDQVEELANFNIASTEIDTSQAFFDENSYAARQTPATFNGGTLKPTTTHTFTQDFTIDATGGTVDDTNGDVTFSGVLSGAGGFTVQGANSVILTGADTYTGGTTIASGTLQIGDGGTTGSIIGNVVDDGTLAFARTDNIQFDGTISGTGGTEIKSGGVVLTAANTYTGTTQVDSGATLQLGAGGATGTVAGDVVDNGSLSFDHSNNVTFAGAISGTGGLSQVGAGTLTLTGASTYTGATAVMSGVLDVEGSTVSASTVNSGATLIANGSLGSATVKSGATVIGSGSVAGLTVNSGGTVSPGNNSVATLTVKGNVALPSGSTFVADITPSSNDLIAATGTATLGGVVDINVGGGTYTIGDEIKLVSAAGGLSGGFSSFDLNGSFASSIKPKLAYDGNDAYLLLAPNAISPFLTSSASQNEIKVAAVIDALLADDKGTAFTPLFGLTAGELQTTLSQLSGEIGASPQQSGIELSAQFLDLLLNPFIDARGGIAGASGPALAFAPRPTQGFHVSLASSPTAARVQLGDHLLAHAANANDTGGITASAVGGTMGVWVSAYGAKNDTDGDTFIGSHDTHANQTGFAVGIDFRPADDFVMGLAGGGARQTYKLSNAMGNGKANVSQGGLYLSKRFDEAYVSFSAAYSEYDTRITRNVVLGGLNRYSSKFNAHDYGMRLEGGERMWDWDSISVTPYGAIVSNHFSAPEHSEKTVLGSTAFALDYAYESKSETTSELGLKFDTTTGDTQVFNLHAGAAWQYDFNPGGNAISATFAGLGGPAFTVDGAAAPKNAALLELGVDTQVADGLSLGLKVNALLANRSTGYGGTGMIQYRW